MTTPFKNLILPVNKGLLWKEWQQNRMYFLVAFLIMSYDPLIKPLGYGIKDLLGAGAGRYTVTHALGNISGLLSASYHNTFEQMGMYIVILLGVIILVQERSGSLNYLVGTPVSRTEIITAKFLTGSAAITGIIAINALFMIIVGLLLPVSYSTGLVLKWAVLTTAVFLALFSLGLLVASFTGHLLSALCLSMLFTGLPSMLGAMIINYNTIQIFNFSPAFILKVNMIIHYLTIPAYISRDSEYMQNAAAAVKYCPNYPLETFLLILLMGLFVMLAVKWFKNNPLENNGQMLMSGNATHIAQIVLATIIAVGNASMGAESIGGFWGFMVITFIVAYLVIILLSALVYYIKLGR